ncbi:MBL fold metallo-hydrolase [Albibacterium bauzanense]|uniref:Phosphoribosyl 1,2-cyclic phosphate phosphodiesterase n=1 Tax=Albibacterium bauzanense TaxID=653929 RepID=A0A4R1M1T0_9SPHI|nr:MBL fold metallo-hydrolase [Albibacterium bauzanense]TCK84804.1 phosphoribosyl 1,2-cyclic phosphate phosphodiesterase [Albibacterium bauzanense]
MTITFLGTGTSQGVPVIACECPVCLSTDKRDKRLRSSILIEINGKNIVIDTGPDFRYQMLRENVKHLDAILFTHEHKDHIAGLDDIRAFNYKQKAAIPIYASQRVIKALEREFYYIFSSLSYPGIPQVHIHEITNDAFTIDDIKIRPIEVQHFKLPVMGFRINDFTYITDAKTVDDDEFQKIIGTKVLVINALQREKHISHFTLSEAISFAKKINAERTYFTHISHLLGKHSDVSNELPEAIFLAYDGLKLTL